MTQNKAVSLVVNQGSIFGDRAQGWLNRFILVLFFAFPILIATVNHAASVIYAILILVSLFRSRGAWALLCRREKLFLLGLCLFFLMSSLSLFMTEDLRNGIQRLEKYLRLLGVIPVYLMLRKERLESVHAFFAGMSIAVFVMLGQGLYEVEVLGGQSANGAYHKIIFGNMAILFSTFVFIRAVFYGRKKVHYLLTGLVVSAGAYASLLSDTRTAWLFVPLIIGSLIWLYRKKLDRKIWQRVTFCLVVFLILIVMIRPERLVRGFEHAQEDLRVFQEDPARYSSLGARLVMWQNSILIFKGSPLFGTGLGDFRNDSQILLKKGLSPNNEFAVNQSNAHNIYFQILAEGGLLGLTLLLLTVFILPFIFLYDLWQGATEKNLHCYALSGLVLLIAFAWFGTSESWLNRSPLITSYCVSIVVFLSSAMNRAEEKA